MLLTLLHWSLSDEPYDHLPEVTWFQTKGYLMSYELLETDELMRYLPYYGA